jgi:hypothetical protein
LRAPGDPFVQPLAPADRHAARKSDVLGRGAHENIEFAGIDVEAFRVGIEKVRSAAFRVNETVCISPVREGAARIPELTDGNRNEASAS